MPNWGMTTVAWGLLAFGVGFGCDSSDDESKATPPGTGGSSEDGGRATGGDSSSSGSSSSGSSATMGDKSGTGGMNEVPMQTYAYFGIGTWGGDGAVAVYKVDAETLELSLEKKEAVGTMNSFGAFLPDKTRLYLGDEGENKIRAYAVDASSGLLAFESDATAAGGPVYLTVDLGGNFLLSSYFGAGSVESFALGSQGALGGSTDVRSTGDKSHSIVLSPDQKFAFVPNRDSNDVSRLGFAPSTGAFSATTPASVALAGGPRHMVFHPNGKYAYVVTEFAASVAAYSYEPTTGTLTLIEGGHDAFATGAAKKGADIHITPDGSYLYASNRAGADSTIAMFSIGQDGRLTSLGHEKTRGSSPRNFAIHPSGKYLLVANHESNNVASFRIGADGQLSFVKVTDVGDAVYWVGFLQLPQ